METEFEAKFYPVDKEKYRKKLQEIGAELIAPERKMRRSIYHNSNFKCDYIRIRDEGDKVTFSAKIHANEDGQISDQKEAVVTVNNYDTLIMILEAMGFKPDTYQETLRETWKFQEAEITIDTWPGLETYSEIEAHSEEEVKKIAELLELDWNNKILTSVVEIYGKKYNIPYSEVNDKLKNTTFENNPFTK